MQFYTKKQVKNMLQKIFIKKLKNFVKKVDIIFVMPYNVTVARGWRNWQTRTFEGRMVTPCGFKSRSSHQNKGLVFDQSFFCFSERVALTRFASKYAIPSLRSLRTNFKKPSRKTWFFCFYSSWDSPALTYKTCRRQRPRVKRMLNDI